MSPNDSQYRDLAGSHVEYSIAKSFSRISNSREVVFLSTRGSLEQVASFFSTESERNQIVFRTPYFRH